MISKNQYIEYLLNTPINYTCSKLSEHLENVSHDCLTDFLQNSKFTPKKFVGVREISPANFAQNCIYKNPDSKGFPLCVL
jgi:hypothetical protein